jgi:lipid-A-disaccharide synthase
MRYYIIAGEASGDMHAANLMKELKALDPVAHFRCWGGDRMAEAGGELVKHYRDLAFMGFLEVAVHLRTILGNLRMCREDILAYRPDVLILVDYPGFNLRIARFAKEQGIRVVYYISPQVWAWKKSRVFGIRKNVGLMLVILPFEKEFYARYDYPVEFVGHPLLDAVGGKALFESPAEFAAQNGLTAKPIIALLPGSRKQEISRMLPLMAGMAGYFTAYQFVIAGAPSMEPGFYPENGRSAGLPVIFGQTHELLRHAHAALVTSGTATLETALFGVPQVVCYRGSAVSFAIARRIVDVKFISLPNLVMDRQVVRELIQNDFREAELRNELGKLLDEGNRKRIMGDYRELREKLGGEGASARAAEKIHRFIQH